MKLSEFFSRESFSVDVDVNATHYSNSSIKGTITFAETEFYLNQALENNYVVVIITLPRLAEGLETEKCIVISESPKKTLFDFHNFMFDQGFFNLVDKKNIALSAKIASTAVIKDNVIIEDDVVIEDFVVIESNTILKKGVFVGAHAIVGARGMHNTFLDSERVWVKDAGGVVIDEDVQILSNTTVQKSYFFEATIIGKQSIVSVQCNIGHATKIGGNTLIAGNAQIAGYVTIGSKVWIGPSVSVAHGLTIGDSAEVLIGSTVINNIAAGARVSGNFAMNHTKNIRKFTREAK